ncbi:MAG: FAD-binding oxidoreductase [Candidatus Thiodiazotropha sp. (ex Ustalcina ferruginea)]|nr:FAD-binding oxidoreductase [Candidatus Thiodiazotropha sp. (ex Ustalcina ferruginea)]
MDQSAVEQQLDCNMVNAGLYERNIAVMQPCKLVREWKRLATEVGADIYENTPAVRMDRDGDKVVIKTPRGTITADRIVLATNGYSHLLGGGIGKEVKRDQMPMIPVMHVTEKLTPDQWQRAVSRSWLCPLHTAFGLYHGYTPTADGRLVMWYFKDIQTSANKEIRPYEYDVENREEALKHLRAILPGLEGVRIQQTWGGPLSVTMDLVPHLGFVGNDDRVILSSGCAGHGVSMGMLNGRTIAELLLDQDTDNSRLWFVTRKKRSWPPAGLAPLGVRAFVGAMRLEHRMDIKKSALSEIK